MKPFSFLALMLSLLSAPLFADSASTNYSLVEDRFTGGGGSASSTSYQIVETSLEFFSGESASSSNYGVNPTVGISGSPIATLNMISPAAYSKHYSDESPSYTVTAVDPDSDTLQYQVKQGSTVKDGPQTSNVLGWALSSSDIGRHTLSFEVIDPDGTVVKQQPAYVLRRPTK